MNYYDDYVGSMDIMQLKAQFESEQDKDRVICSKTL